MPEECKIPRALSCAPFHSAHDGQGSSPKAFSPCLQEPGKKKHSWKTAQSHQLLEGEVQSCPSTAAKGWVLGWCWGTPQLETEGLQIPAESSSVPYSPKVSPAWGLSWGTPVAAGTERSKPLLYNRGSFSLKPFHVSAIQEDRDVYFGM